MADSAEDEDAAALPQPAYAGEDVRPTSTKEIFGFYTYSFAAEVFVVTGLGAFVPVILEALARASPDAVLAHDRSKPCGYEAPVPPTDTPAARSVAAGEQCVFPVLGLEVNTASFAMYTFSISVLFQALLVVTMSGAADHGKNRKTLLLTFAAMGSIATILFLAVTPAVSLLGSLLAIIGNMGVGASFVLLNSFLPLLVRNHPEVRQARKAREDRALDTYRYASDGHRRIQSDQLSIPDIMDPSAALLQSEPLMTTKSPASSAPSAEMRVSTRISAYGTGIGYSGAVITQILSVIILQTTGASLFSLRLVIFMLGLWWLTFTIPAAFFFRPRPGPPLSVGKSGSRYAWIYYIGHSWSTLGRTIMRARRLKDILLFLLAWFMVSDSVATVSGTAILFAKTTLGMQPSALALINLTVTVFGIVGALAWSAISRGLKLKPGQTILACMCLFELIPLYGLLGYIPAIRRGGTFGLQQPWEMYPLSAVYGLVLGGLASYCRSLYGELIPPGNEAAFYALYAITDKGSSVFGPAIVGAITDATGDIRPAFWFLAVLIGLPIPILYFVDVDRGKREGMKLAQENLDASRTAWEEEEESSILARGEEDSVESSS